MTPIATSITDGVTLTDVAKKKRVRERKFAAFGDLLRTWRGDREIEVVARHVRGLGVDLDGATLRGWEYGWSGQPDPIRLLAVAQYYGKNTDDVLQALATSRGITIKSRTDPDASASANSLPRGGTSKGLQDSSLRHGRAGARVAAGTDHGEAVAVPRAPLDADVKAALVKALGAIGDALKIDGQVRRAAGLPVDAPDAARPRRRGGR